MSRLLAVILAGGEGRRLGGPKEGVRVGGGTLLSRAWDALAPVTSRLILQGAATAPDGITAASDLRPGEGPLAGIEAALRTAAEEGVAGVVVRAVDLPRVSAPILLELVRRWRASPDPPRCAVVAEPRRGVQPLAAVYGVELGPALSRWMDETGERSARAWVESLEERAERVSETTLAAIAGHPEPFLNVNRPSHVDRALTLPPPGPPLVSVVGWKDSGKTSVAVGLVAALRERGHRVMALKHGHGFRLDTPGTDSYRLRHEAGADRVVLAGPDEMAILGGWGEVGELGVTRLAARYLWDADVVVVEGWKREPLPAIEVVDVGRDDREPLWSPASVDADRFLARVLRNGGSGSARAGRAAGAPAAFTAEDPALPARLAELVEERVIPGTLRVRCEEG